MSQSTETVETTVAGTLLGQQEVNFFFVSDNKSTRKVDRNLNPPGSLHTTLIALQGYNLEYTDEDFELKNIQVSLSVSGKQASCTATLRDRNLDSNGNGKKWEGSVDGLVMYFKK